MDLSSYLLKPVQRMGKYALILKQILKECPESAAEYQDLTIAQDMIKFCLQHGNDLLAMDALKVSEGTTPQLINSTKLNFMLQVSHASFKGLDCGKCATGRKFMDCCNCYGLACQLRKFLFLHQ